MALRNQLARAVRAQETGSIAQVLDTFRGEEVTNDGANFVQTMEIQPDSQVPGGYGQDIRIRITDQNLDVTQMDKTFLSFTIRLRIHFSDLLATSGQSAVTAAIQQGMFLFFGLKNSSDIIGDYTIFHRGVAVTGTLQNHATTESFCYHVLED